MKKFAPYLIVLLLPILALSADNHGQVPYSATLASTSFVITYPTAGANAPGCEGLEPFFGLNWGLITIDAIGNSTLMGLVTDHQHHCTPLPFDPELAGPPPLGVPMPFVNGYAELRAANGDKIWGTYHGLATFTLAGMIIDGDLTTTGGTGRFEGANGLGHAFGVQSPNSAAMTITGTMTSPGEARKNK